jgi:DNA-binding transcriptional MerR regulator
MPPSGLKVGELAKRTGLSVRTLHYYDEIGLLAPSQHTASGHRLYTAGDVARLQQIASLRQLGLPLEEIRACLERPDFSPLRVLEMHLARLREQLELQQRLCQRLESIAAGLRRTEAISVEEFVQTIEVMTMFEKYYTPEQLQEIQERGKTIGEAGLRRAEADWKELLDQVQAAMDRGVEPTSEPVLALARRWQDLVNQFTGGNPGIEKSLREMYKQEPDIGARHGFGPNPAMFEYIGKAMKAVKQ